MISIYYYFLSLNSVEFDNSKICRPLPLPDLKQFFQEENLLKFSKFFLKSNQKLIKLSSYIYLIRVDIRETSLSTN